VHQLTYMFAAGGPALYLILAAGLLHMVLVITAVVLAAMRKFDLSPALWAMVLVIVLLGFNGAIFGQITGYSAIAHASPEMKQTLLASGISMALYSAELSLIVGIVAVGSTGIASTLARNLVPRKGTGGAATDADAAVDPDLYMPE